VAQHKQVKADNLILRMPPLLTPVARPARVERRKEANGSSNATREYRHATASQRRTVEKVVA